MKAKCIETARCSDGRALVTKGRVYDVTPGQDPSYVTVHTSDLGGDAYLSADRFETTGDSPQDPLVEKASDKMDQALRFNADKPEMFYADMFPLALAEVSRTLTYGTKRARNPYPRFNWCKGAPFLQLYDCARRHMVAWLRGEKNDRQASEDGFEINNLAFTCGNLLRLLEQELRGQAEFDDRYKPEEK